MNITAVIVTYNAERWLHRCLKSLTTSTVSVHVIVVDNGSTDNTISMIREGFSDMELIISEQNLGFGQANNIGIQKAIDDGSNYVLLLNQDAWVETDTIEHLCKNLENNPLFGILSPMHCNASFTELDYNFSRYLADVNNPEILSDIYFDKMKEVYEVKFVNAAIWLIRRECFLKVGLFSPLFFHYGEDINYVQRVKYHGFKLGVCPKLRGVHDRDGRKGVPQKFMGIEAVKRKMLFEFADVNNNDYRNSVDRKLKNSVKFLTFALLKGNFKKAKKIFEEFNFLNTKKSAIFETQKMHRAPYIHE